MSKTRQHIKTAVSRALRIPPRSWVHRAAAAPLRLKPGPFQHACLKGVDLALRSGHADTLIVGGLKVNVETEDLVQRVIFVRGAWEPGMTATVEALLAPGDQFVDIGAHIGYYTLLASTKVGSGGSVMAFEPNPAVFAKLAQNVADNNLFHVTVNRMAIGKTTGHATLYTGPPSNLGISTLSDQAVAFEDGGATRAERLHGTGIEVEVRPIGEVLTDLRRPTVIKVDAEGMEADILESLEDLLSTDLPELALLVEVTPEWRSAGAGEAWIDDFASRNGFTPYMVPDSYGIPGMYTDTAGPIVPGPVGAARGDVALVRGAEMLDRISKRT